MMFHVKHSDKQKAVFHVKHCFLFMRKSRYLKFVQLHFSLILGH